ncbi:DUF6252 family protein [Flavobacteriaceae bacterium]|nr:DUF6252 family protein [Flavobacteriaceae bacterium]MDC1492015.1 DUF6252 family protein [Flavobacteriaceae bacterium]MDC1534764.1 DUF6252 family protein [Flavobacteriaceae bacterium]
MKKIIYLLFVSFIISSCTSQIEYRIPAFQATINGSTNWDATNFSVTTNALGEGIITGNDFNSSISLRFPSLNIGVYDLRENLIGEATYQDTIQYSTLNDGIASIAYFSDGEISINEITSDSKISGTFNFNAYNSSGESTINVSQGIFYRLPLTQTPD